MPQEIERQEQYLPQLAQEPVEGVPEGGSKGNPLLKLLASARRHWVMVLLVWVFVGVPGGAAVWLLVKPTYTATGFVKVEPVTAILFPEVDAQQQGSGFDAFLNTQAQEISGGSVLNAALADPTLKNLPQAGSVDDLREALTVSVIPKTHLLRVGVKQNDPEVAIRMTKAILGAYKTCAGGAAAKELERKRSILVSERKRLSDDLDLRRMELYTLAKRYGATSETIDALREALARSSEEAHKEKTRADSDVIQLEEQIKELGLSDVLTTMPAEDTNPEEPIKARRLDDAPAAIWATVARLFLGGGKQPDARRVPTTMPVEDFNWREARIESDPVVKALRGQIDAEALFLLRHADNTLHQKLKADLEAQLEKRRTEVTEEADRKLAERREQINAETKRRLTQQLQAAKRRQTAFDTQIDKREKESLEMGQTGLEIRKLQDRLESIDRDYKIIDQTLGKMDIENRRPDRITVADDAEILPGGKDDKRIKLLPVAILGALFLGLGLAFLRDLISGRLYCGGDVEAGMGLRLLGSLPALDDLRRGLVTDQDFRESYRAIQATLAGVSPDGRVPRALLVTSAQAAEGKTSLAVSLAVSLAESGNRVLVIDGDVQAPRIAQTLKLDLPFGLRHVLLGERSLAEAAGPTPIPGLDVLLSSRNGQSASGMLNSRRAASLLKAAAERYDHIIIDSPPVLGSADALIWAPVVDGVIFSSFAGYSSMKVARLACTRTVNAGGRIIGAVVCNVPVREHYYSYSYAASRPSGAESADGAARPAGQRALPLVRMSTPPPDSE